MWNFYINKYCECFKMTFNPRENICWLSHCQSLHNKVATDLFQNNESTYVYFTCSSGFVDYFSKYAELMNINITNSNPPSSMVTKSVRLVWFWLDHFSKKVQKYFSLPNIKCIVKNKAEIWILEYFESLKVE